MLLSGDLMSELIELGVLNGDETCALCAERPVLLATKRVARADSVVPGARQRHAAAIANRLAELCGLARCRVMA